uniref:Uncharacterized protein n=1 Tax=Setaria italica TaxID=4555 RepID=K3YFT9_SETIT
MPSSAKRKAPAAPSPARGRGQAPPSPSRRQRPPPHLPSKLAFMAMAWGSDAASTPVWTGMACDP